MTLPYATVQAGSGIIGSAAGTTVIVEADAADQFGEGATIIVWPSGKNLDPSIHNYETMLVSSKSGATLTVVRGTEEDPTGFSTFAAGDQVALAFPAAPRLRKQQTQVITVGRAEADGPMIDLGDESFGIIGLITGTISNVDLDGGTPPFDLSISLVGSFDGSNWSNTVNTASGTYANPAFAVFHFTAADPAPLYAQFFISRYIRFHHIWQGVGGAEPNVGANVSATLTFVLEYF